MSGIIVCRHRADEDYGKVVACHFQAWFAESIFAIVSLIINRKDVFCTFFFYFFGATISKLVMIMSI